MFIWDERATCPPRGTWHLKLEQSKPAAAHVVRRGFGEASPDSRLFFPRVHVACLGLSGNVHVEDPSLRVRERRVFIHERILTSNEQGYPTALPRAGDLHRPSAALIMWSGVLMSPRGTDRLQYSLNHSKLGVQKGLIRRKRGWSNMRNILDQYSMNIVIQSHAGLDGPSCSYIRNAFKFRRRVCIFSRIYFFLSTE